MHTADWIVIGLYLAAIVGMGVALSRRAGESSENYLVAGRKLRWWVIGLSDTASAAGGDAYWVYVLFTGAFMGFYRVWWIGAVLALPLAVVWARYWRRLRLLSPTQLYEERYSGRAAARFRGFSAVYAALVPSVIVLGYVLSAFAQVLDPFLPWNETQILLVFGGISVLYTMLGGLIGVAYSDVPQFILLMLGRILLAVAVVGAAGGVVAMLDAVELLRGPDFLQTVPPSANEDAHGAFVIEPLSFLALALAGLFGISSVQSAPVQRSLAARSELDAALGQILHAVLYLVVRMLPLIFVGLAAVVLYNEADIEATDIWAEMVMEYAGPGLLGLLLVGVVAGYMSTIDTFLNFLVAGLFNDFYRRHIRPNAADREQVIFCRIATFFVVGVAVLWGYVLIDEVDAKWLNFINTVIGLFVLPTALLRWVWWRMNIWGEIVGFVLGFPLGYIVWFPLGFHEEPYWKAFLVLAGLGCIAIVTVTLLTPAEPRDVLVRFYRKVRPPGFWGPIAAELDADERSSGGVERRLDLAAAGVGFVFCASLIVAVASSFARQWVLCATTGALALGCGVMFVRLTIRAEAVRRVLGQTEEG